MRVIKKVIISATLWVLLIVFENNATSISDCIWESMNILMPVVIVLIGIRLALKSILK